MPLLSPYAYDSMGAWLGNRFNWLGLVRLCVVVTNPPLFFAALFRKEAPQSLSLRTPVGTVTLQLRNFESLKTLFTVFCREDYRTGSDRPSYFCDIGANIGLAAVYFLTRHPGNRVRCFEPDATNLDCLRRNLAPFADRAHIEACAVAPRSGEAVIYRAENGKNSALRPSRLAQTPQKVATRAFGDVLAEAARQPLPVVVKLDVEGLEKELVESVRFEDHPRLERIIIESTECARLITRVQRRTLRNGYVEDLRFVG